MVFVYFIAEEDTCSVVEKPVSLLQHADKLKQLNAQGIESALCLIMHTALNVTRFEKVNLFYMHRMIF